MSATSNDLGRQVRAHFHGERHRTHAEGEIVAYYDGPQCAIKTPSGEIVWWRADLIEVQSPNREDEA